MVSTKRGFHICANLTMIILSLCSILPFILLFTASITDESTLTRNGYSFFPTDISFRAYEYLFQSSGRILKAYMMTILATAVGTTLNVVMTMFFAYLLSKENLPGRNAISFFVFFTMLFSGGMVPSYIVWSQYMHISDTFFALIFPNLALSAFNIILMRTYFTSNVPKEILEAAEMDSCGEIGKLFYISIPVSKPMIATVALFSALAYWNDWINGLYYLLRKPEYYTIQNVLNTMMNNVQFLKDNTATVGTTQITSQIPTSGVRMAIAVIAVIPILIIYPFFQKSFIKGIVIGGVKG